MMNRSDIQPINHMHLAQQIGDQQKAVAVALQDYNEAKRELADLETRLKAAFDYKGAGSNNTERDHALAAHVQAETTTLIKRLHEAEEVYQRVQTELEALLALRRGMEWDTRTALAEAVNKAAVSNNHTYTQRNAPAGDDAFDASLDAATARIAELLAENTRMREAMEKVQAEVERGPGPWNRAALEEAKAAAHDKAFRGQGWAPPPPPLAANESYSSSEGLDADQIAALAFGDYSGLPEVPH